MKTVIYGLCAMLSLASVCAEAPPPPQAAPPAGSAQETKNPPTNIQVDSKGRPVPSYLILGTVFNEKALALPGVEVRVRRAGEKKFAWDTYTNSRGEFAVRVFPGYEYEVVIHMKKYQDVSTKIDAKVDVQQRLSIKLLPSEQGKAGAKP